MSESIRVHVEHIRETGGRETLWVDSKDVPKGMTPKKCARWMLARATEALQEPDTKSVQAKD